MLNPTIDNAPRVNGERLWSRLMAMARIGATPTAAATARP